jgi:hypothetical protein
MATMTAGVTLRHRPLFSNGTQRDFDLDGAGDVCEFDDDNTLA